jgi:hypothetical protein
MLQVTDPTVRPYHFLSVLERKQLPKVPVGLFIKAQQLLKVSVPLNEFFFVHWNEIFGIESLQNLLKSRIRFERYTFG